MREYQIIGSWLEKTGSYKYVDDPWAFYSIDQPRPAVGTVFWEDGKTQHEIRYLMINGTGLNIMAMNNLQDSNDRHTWAIHISLTGDKDTIIIFELPDDLELKNVVGMHMNSLKDKTSCFRL